MADQNPWEDQTEVQKQIRSHEAELTGKGLAKIASALDYIRGLSRTGVAAAADPFVKGDLVRGDEVLKALKLQGDFPTSDEYMARAGVPKGYKVSDKYPSAKDKWYDFTLRGTGGAVADEVVDPANLVGVGKLLEMMGRGARAAKILQSAPVKALTRPTISAATAVTKPMYHSGMKELNAAAQAVGKGMKWDPVKGTYKVVNGNPVSDILWEHNIAGTAKSIQDQSVDLMAQLRRAAEATERKASSTGYKVDPNGIFNHARYNAKGYATNPKYEGEVADFLDELSRFENKGPVYPSQLSDWKGSFARDADYSAGKGGKMGKRATVTEDLNKMAGLDTRIALEDAIDNALPGEAAAYRKGNEDLGTLLSAVKSMDNEKLKGMRKNVFTTVDAMYGALPLIFGQPGVGQKAAEALLAKKLGDFSKTKYFRTKIPMTMKKVRDSAVAYPVLKEAEIETLRKIFGTNSSDTPEQDPWDDKDPWEE